MRYHYIKPIKYTTIHGKTYKCDHPVYDKCTLYLEGPKGLAVIQQKVRGKKTYWTKIDPWLIDDIYYNENFKSYFSKKSGGCTDGLYPTVTLRQIMWALKMKPIVRERWETYFDRPYI